MLQNSKLLHQVIHGRKNIYYKEFCNYKFDPNQLSSLVTCFFFKTMEINNINIKLKFIDKGGKEKFIFLSLSHFGHVDFVLFVFDLNEPKSFEGTQYQINLFNENDNGKKIKNKYLEGNKKDLGQYVDQNLPNEII